MQQGNMEGVGSALFKGRTENLETDFKFRGNKRGGMRSTGKCVAICPIHDRLLAEKGNSEEGADTVVWPEEWMMKLKCL